MCLLIFAHRFRSDLPLVVSANRDEFHGRPTAPAQFWEQHPQLLAGRDLEQGGTWMGVTRDGRFAAITNYRDPSRTAPAPRSRGELPLDYLVGDRDPQDYVHDLVARAGDYAGFNLLVGDLDSLWYLSNSQPDHAGGPRWLEPGVYGLSNALLDTPWPKVELGKVRLSQLLAGEAPRHDSLSEVVADRRPASPEELQRQGMEGGMEQVLSAQFIVTESYGTRSSTSLWLDRAGSAEWRELSFDSAGRLQGQVEERFTLDGH
jgi:uncharacterized protein with NRDE domain